MSEYVFKLPDLGEGMVESEIGEWFVKVGDDVAEEDVIGTMMTDKAAVELSSPVSGRVTQLAGEPGDMVAVGAALITFDVEGVGESSGGETEGEAALASGRPHGGLPQEGGPLQEGGRPHGGLQRSGRPSKGGGRPHGGLQQGGLQQGGQQKRVMTSPAIRRRAKEAGIDLASVTGTGPGGRVTRDDFEAFLDSGIGGENRPHGGLPHTADAPHPADVPHPSGRPQAATREIKVIGLRRIIAERMSAATREIPHFTYVEEVDITEIESLRRHLNSKQPDATLRLTPLPFLGLALIRALREFPQCNATYDKERNVILQHAAVHLGIATQTTDGLKVPVVRNADRLSLDGLAADIRRVSEAARNNTITRDELTGSTITITSLGKLGGIVSTPVINMPEVGIIGVNRAIDKPVVFNGQVTIRTMMNLSSSFDHRFVDGYDAAAMIQSIREMLEHPALLFQP